MYRSTPDTKKKVKKMTKWEMGGNAKDLATLDYTDGKGDAGDQSMNGEDMVLAEEEVRAV